MTAPSSAVLQEIRERDRTYLATQKPLRTAAGFARNLAYCGSTVW